jgi:hypothetical protein
MQREAADPLEALPTALVAAIFARLNTRSLLHAGQVMATGSAPTEMTALVQHCAVEDGL